MINKGNLNYYSKTLMQKQILGNMSESKAENENQDMTLGIPSFSLIFLLE